MRKEFPKDHVSDFFKKPMYELTYKAMIYPVLGQDDWVKMDTPDIEPHVFATKPRRKKKKRRPSVGEGQDCSVKISTITCSNCKLKGHRYTTCTKPLKPHFAIMKAGHKSNRKLPENIGVPPLTAASPSCTIASTPSPALAAPPRQPIAHAAPAPRQPLAHAAPPPHQPSAHAAPTHQQHVHDSWTGRGRARGSDHYTKLGWKRNRGSKPWKMVNNEPLNTKIV